MIGDRQEIVSASAVVGCDHNRILPSVRAAGVHVQVTPIRTAACQICRKGIDIQLYYAGVSVEYADEMLLFPVKNGGEAQTSVPVGCYVQGLVAVELQIVNIHQLHTVGIRLECGVNAQRTNGQSDLLLLGKRNGEYLVVVEFWFHRYILSGWRRIF